MNIKKKKARAEAQIRDDAYRLLALHHGFASPQQRELVQELADEGNEIAKVIIRILAG